MWPGAGQRDRRWQVEQLPTLLGLLAQRVRTGSTLRQAFGAVAIDGTVSGPGLERALAQADHGVPFREALDRWARELAHSDADLVRAVLAAGLETGGALAITLDHTASSLRERAEIDREVRSLAAQTRASALVLTLTPLAFLVLFCIVDPAVAGVVFAPGIGRLLVVIGVVLDIAGWRWLRRIERSVTA